MSPEMLGLCRNGLRRFAALDLLNCRLDPFFEPHQQHGSRDVHLPRPRFQNGLSSLVCP